MTVPIAIQRLISEGARNIRQLVRAMWAFREGAPDASAQCLCAIQKGLATVTSNEFLALEMSELLADLRQISDPLRNSQAVVPHISTIRGRIVLDRANHWAAYAQKFNVPLWSLIEEVMDDRTGYGAQNVPARMAD